MSAGAIVGLLLLVIMTGVVAIGVASARGFARGQELGRKSIRDQDEADDEELVTVTVQNIHLQDILLSVAIREDGKIQIIALPKEGSGSGVTVTLTKEGALFVT